MAQESDYRPDPDGDYAAGRYVTCYSSEEFLAALESIRRYTPFHDYLSHRPCSEDRQPSG